MNPNRERTALDAIRAEMASIPGHLGFYYKNLVTGYEYSVRGDEAFSAASVIKLPLMMHILAEAAAGRMEIVVSGHVSDKVEDQIRELKRMQESGAAALVMVSNRLAAADEDDDVLLANMNKILDAIPDAKFGMYECPYPYKRLLSDKVLEAMAESGRFAFIKDTCCDAELIAHRVKVLDGRCGLFNANTATLLDTLRAGADGFSGIMANLHPELYAWLFRNYQEQPEKADRLSAFLSLASGIERALYPTSAKYHMNKVGIKMSMKCRHQELEKFHPLFQREIDDLITLEKVFGEEFKL